MWYKLTDTTIRQIVGGSRSDLSKFRSFIAANGFTRYCRAGAQDWKRFFTYGRDSSGFPHVQTDCPPNMDHERTFKNPKTGLICLTYQPYSYVEEIRPEVERWAADRGLRADIYDPEHSWYYPGSTCLIVIHLPGTEIYLDRKE